MTRRWADLVDPRLAIQPVDPWAPHPVLVKSAPRWTEPTRQMPEVKR